MVEDSLTGEVSDEDEVAEIDEDNLHHENVRRRNKVGQVVQHSSALDLDTVIHSLVSQPDLDSVTFRLMMQY